MNLELWYLKGQSEAWVDAAADEYAKKIGRFFTFQRVAIKSKSLDREDAEAKKAAEAKALLAKIESGDLVVLFDEKGRPFKNSKEFSATLVKLLGRQSRRVIFIIGGPYGFTDELRDRADDKWSLGALTMNHHVAQVAALEQVYRALSIWRGLPYHND